MKLKNKIHVSSTYDGSIMSSSRGLLLFAVLLLLMVYLIIFVIGFLV